MTRRVMGAALAVALATLGCQAVVENMPKTDQEAREARYGLLGLAGLTATASSIENSYYPAAKVLDGNLITAWAPSPADPAPALTLDLGGAKVVDAFAIKLSPAGTQVAVQAYVNGAWTTVASGLTPPSAVMTSFDLPNPTTAQLRLLFSGVAAADLYVCEVTVEGAAPTPRPPCQCKVTGGGYVYKDNGTDKVTFGLVAMEDQKGGAKGTIQVTDHAARKKYHGTVTGIICDNNNMTVTFTGTLRGGGSFTSVITDNGEPGVDDAFLFRAGAVTLSGLLGDDDGGGGNLQVHRDQCP